MPMEHVSLPSVALPMRRLRTDGPSMGFLMRTDQAANSHTGGWKSTVIELRPHRGVKKEDYARKNIYDVWFPNLEPSEELLKASTWTEEPGWRKFKRHFLAEMKETDRRGDIDLLAALSKHTNLSVGCYCESETHCHRSLLRVLLENAGAEIA